MTITNSHHLESASTIVIDDQGRLLLQLRDDIPGVIYPGKISLFGGHREGDETFLACAVRELHEELSYYIDPAKFEFLVAREEEDCEVSGGTIRIEIFVVRDIPVHELVITEGALLIKHPSDVRLIEHQLTPCALFALHLFLQQSSGNKEASG
jgi:8-oxo-dGTP diphosphatase